MVITIYPHRNLLTDNCVNPMKFVRLDGGSHVPLYLQLSSALIAQIGSGELKPGDRIPSERELAAELGVSRITARQAIDMLLRNGLVYREQGRGTFVAEPKMRGLKGFLSFTEDILSRGMQPGTRVLKQELAEADEAEQTRLKLQPGEKVLRLVRLRLANGAPVALQSSVLPARICPGLEHEDLTDKSLFSVLRQKYFVHPAWTEAEVEARSAAAEEAELLRLAPGDPVLVITGLTFTETFEFVESVRTVYRGNDMAIYIGRQRL